MIISKLGNSNGFFSAFFFTVNHYITARKNNYNFILNTDTWLFRHRDGWTDYFEKIDITYNEKGSEIVEHTNSLGNYPLYEYAHYMKEMYVYNETTIKRIEKTKMELNLTDGNYDSIFIRRGDKIYNESPYIPSEIYIEGVLKKNPNCKTIFLQTDDYNSYIDLNNYIKERNLDIRLITLCDENTKGMVVTHFISEKDFENSCHENQNKRFDNKEYMNKIIHDIKKTTPVYKLNKDEIYDHTITLLVGIELLLKSNICVCEYFSNISRFIKLMHPNPDNVLDIYKPDNIVDLNCLICPSYVCSFYPIY